MNRPKRQVPHTACMGGDLVPHGSGRTAPVVPDPRCTCCDIYARSVPHAGLVPAALQSLRSGRDVAGRPCRLTGPSRHVMPDLVAQAIAHGLAELVVGEDTCMTAAQLASLCYDNRVAGRSFPRRIGSPARDPEQGGELLMAVGLWAR
jgi:hypothetical protein